MTERKWWMRPEDAPLHHDWLPEDDDANQCREGYWLPKPDEIWEHARQLREQRTGPEKYYLPGPNFLCAVPVRRRPF
jgi:hypothetical protein